MIITDLCVFEVVPGEGLGLVELHPGVTLDDVRARTGCEFQVALLTEGGRSGLPAVGWRYSSQGRASSRRSARPRLVKADRVPTEDGTGKVDGPCKKRAIRPCH